MKIKMKQNIIKILKNQQYYEDLCILETHEKIRLLYVLGHWQRLVQRKKANQLAFEIIDEK